MSDVSLRAILEADVEGFQSAMKQAGDSMRQAADGIKKAFGGMGDESGNATQNMLKNFEAAGEGMADIGKKMTLGITAPLMTGAAASVKAFSNMESAMAGVQKTTDMTDAEISKMKESLQDMSTQAPIAATELAGIAEAAGQLGIENANILSFTETIAMLGTATNMAGEEAATSLARFANITQMSQTDFDRLGSTIVELGNNLATTESEIVNMGLRLAGTGAQIGLTESEIMGLAAAMSSVGIEAEAGGSAMSQTLKKMDAAVRESGAELETYASVAGVTSEEFAQAWQENPTEAITSFIDGLGGMIERGEDANSVLADLGITGIRETDTLLRLAGAAGLTGESFDMANGAWEENTALSDEAATAWDTMASKAQMLWNQIVNLSEAIGEKLAPYIEKAIDAFSGFLDALSGMDDGVINFIIVLGGMAAALGPVLLVGGKLLAFIGKFGTAIQTAGSLLGGLSSMFPAVSAGFKILVGVFKGLFSGITGAFGAIKGVILGIVGVIGGPATIIIGVILALAGVFTYLWQTNETFRDKVIEIWTALGNFFTETIPAIITGIVEWFQQLPEQISETWDNILTGVVEWVQNMWEQALEFGSSFVETILQFFNDLPENIGFALGYVITKVIMWVAEMVQLAIEVGSQFIDNVITFFSELPGKVQTWISDTYSRVSSWASDMWTKAKEAGSQFIQNVITFVQQLPGKVQTWLTNTISRLASWVRDMASKGREAASQLVDATVNGVKSLPGRMLQFGKDVVTGFWNGIQSLGGWIRDKVTGFFTGIIDGAKSALGISSPSKVFKELGGWTMEGFGIGVNKNADLAENAVADVMDNIVKLADYMDLSPAMNIIPMVDAQAIEQVAVNDGVMRTEQQVNKAINHNMNTAKQPAIINLSLGRRDYDFFIEDVTEAQDRKEAIERRKR